MTSFQRHALAFAATVSALMVGYLSYRAGHPVLVWWVDLFR